MSVEDKRGLERGFTSTPGTVGIFAESGSTESKDKSWLIWPI